ncbi:IS3 family transposase [Alicyclobacillus acidoterrestris]|uniref:IS3 family transposase n=1 Tax=Alicyclobacillus TaxID=29330 RepID=UPI001A8F3B0E
MCKVLNVYRSSYYAWLKRPDSERKRRRRALKKQIHEIFLSSRRLYGSPKITQVLRDEGIRVGSKDGGQHHARERPQESDCAQVQSNHQLEAQSSCL